MAKAKASPTMSDDAIRRATGRGWEEWFRLLDTKGAASLAHKAIAQHLYEAHGLSGWWAQSVTVAYERARGLRVKHQARDGSFSANASKTIAAPVGQLFAMWNDVKLRTRWLPNAPIQVRKANADRSLRITWDGGPSSVNVGFFAKGEAKSQVALSHEKLPDLASVNEMKLYWREALKRMKAVGENTV